MPSEQFLAAVDEAVASSSDLMSKLVAAVRGSLQQRQKSTLNLLERDELEQQLRLLQGKEADLCKSYPIALKVAFSNVEKPGLVAQLVRPEVQFDQLELMDVAKVQETVILARTQQVAVLAAESSLAELNTLVSSALGLKVVQPERNLFRPEIYIAALQSTMEQTGISPTVKLDWLGAMGAALGKALNQLYKDISAQLRQRGVRSAGYAISQTPASQLVRSKAESDKKVSGPFDESVLTLDKLRRLLSGDLTSVSETGGARLEAFSRQFSQEFEAGSHQGESDPSDPSDFAATMPAAYEALSEMKQAGQMVDRLSARLSKRAKGGHGTQAEFHTERTNLRRSASSVAQALSLEVVSLMVDNMAKDSRLLLPLQNIIRQLEPALMRLGLVDPRFFSHKQHPARQLLEEITQRSLAFDSLSAPGCALYISNLQEALASIEDCDVQNADPFEQVLSQLKATWSKEEAVRLKNLEHAVSALKHAEQRNILAEKIALEIQNHPDSPKVPEVVIEFLCGPWAQVVAQAKLLAGVDSKATDKYQAFILAMLWSVHPDLAHQNITKLTRLVPRLIGTLREGLETIAYPTIKISKFLEELMGLHQLAFNQARRPLESSEPAIAQTAPSIRCKLIDQTNPWVAPAEALASNFIELPNDSVLPLASEAARASGSVESVHFADLPLGTWVELILNDKWVRTQLTWSSPHGTLFLFTSSFGAPHSMTRRSVDKYLALGKLKVISEQPVVDEALDAVALRAIRNSVDSVI